MKEGIAEVEDFEIGGRVINRVRFADNTVIIAKTQEELQDMAKRLFDTGRKYGMEIDIDKPQVARVSTRNKSLRVKVGLRELKEFDQFKYFGNVFNKRWLLHKVNQDENCYGQTNI